MLVEGNENWSVWSEDRQKRLRVRETGSGRPKVGPGPRVVKRKVTFWKCVSQRRRNYEKRGT